MKQSTIEFSPESYFSVSVNGKQIATELLAVCPNEVYYGWNLTPSIVSCLLSHNSNIRSAVMTLLHEGRIIDLRVAAHLNAIATDSVANSDEFISVEDSMWLAKRVPHDVLAQHTRGSVALAHSGLVGVPISKEDMRRTVVALCDTAHMLYRNINAEAETDIWTRMKPDAPALMDTSGLPIMDKARGLAEALKAVYSSIGIMYAGLSISRLSERHPDCRLASHIARYLRLQRDVKRLAKMADDGGIAPEECGVDTLLLSRVRKPNFEESSIRKCVRHTRQMFSVDFSPLILPLVQSFSASRGKPIFDLAKSLEHIGRVATGVNSKGGLTDQASKKNRKIGYNLLLGLATGQSVATTAINIWGFHAYRGKINELNSYMIRTRALTSGGILHDPWTDSAFDCMTRAFGKGWSERLPDPVVCSKIDAVAMVLQFGNDPLRPVKQHVVDAIWEMVRDAVTDPTLIEMVTGRMHGGVLRNWLFSSTGSMPTGETIINTTRAAAGTFSTLSGIHSVAREFAFLAKYHNFVVHPPSGNKVLISPAPGEPDINTANVEAIAVKAMTNRKVTPTPPEIHRGLRWA